MRKLFFGGIFMIATIMINAAEVQLLDSILSEHYLTGKLTKSENTYDANGNCLSHATYVWNKETNIWDNSGREEDTYDSEGHMLTQTIYTWLTDKKIWRNSVKNEFSYDTKGNCLNRTTYRWNASTDTWDKYLTGISTYDVNGNQLSEIVKQWENGAWKNTGKVEYTYDAKNNLLTSLIYNWKNETFTKTSLYTYSYDSNGNKIHYLYQAWSSSFGWINKEAENWTYDESGHMVCDLHVGAMMYRPGPAAYIQETHRKIQELADIPLLLGANTECGGNGLAFEGTSFGSPMAVAASKDSEYAYRMGYTACAEGAALGLNWSFAPIVDINREFHNPITNTRTFGNDPETIWFAGAADHERLHRQEIVRVTNPEVINDLYLHTPGVVMLSSHCGNWELSGGIEHYFYDGAKMAFDEHTYSVVYKRVESEFWDEVMAQNRCAAIQDRANCCVESKDILRYAVAHRGEHHIYLFPTDQYPYGYAAFAHIGNFMNQPTKTMTGAAALACRMGFSVVYLGMNREARGRYQMTYTLIARDASAKTPEAVMRSYYDLLEADIRRDPANYLWTHKRWK